jgi:sulfopropanediol 3-dehydrogenase
VKYLKKSDPTKPGAAATPTDQVRAMLDAIQAGGEESVRSFARDLDGWSGDIIVSAEEIEAARKKVPQRLKDDIAYAHDNIRRFAEAQLASCRDTEIELKPGLFAGQKLIPVNSAAATAISPARS